MDVTSGWRMSFCGKEGRIISRSVITSPSYRQLSAQGVPPDFTRENFRQEHEDISKYRFPFTTMTFW